MLVSTPHPFGGVQIRNGRVTASGWWSPGRRRPAHRHRNQRRSRPPPNTPGLGPPRKNSPAGVCRAPLGVAGGRRALCALDSAGEPGPEPELFAPSTKAWCCRAPAPRPVGQQQLAQACLGWPAPTAGDACKSRCWAGDLCCWRTLATSTTAARARLSALLAANRGRCFTYRRAIPAPCMSMNITTAFAIGCGLPA